MKPEKIIVASKIDEKTFCRFAIFDTLMLRKRWISPAVFAGILLFCSLLCFLQRHSAQQAELLALVLMAVGLGVPGVYFGTFFHSLKTQARKLRLQKNRLSYTVALSQNGVEVTSAKSGGGHVTYNWNQVFAVYKKHGCVYLYVSIKQAFLLPENCVDPSTEELWDMIASHVPAERILKEK